ncbi:MAG: hypothetical protein O2780_07075 [Proteobacteria bacterium]|nr:hypothetical protein [Pseudomonadota bacterium]MDA1299776.1 hypothetical protein [Pseudomonadota bacterium]
MPSPPSLPSPSDPTQASKPSLPDLSVPKPGQTSKESGRSEGEKKASRKKAAGDLQEAGAKVAEAGQKMGEAKPGEAGSPGEQDPLIPETDRQTESDSQDFADLDPSTSTASDASSASGSEGASGELEAEIQAAQEALQKAGEALQTAAGTLETAATDEERDEAERQLAQARIAVIVASQDLAEVRAVIDDRRAAGLPADEDLDQILADTEAALQQANVAIVIAAGTVMDELPGSASPEDGEGGGPQNARTGQLDKELNESLVIFDESILQARRVLTDADGPAAEPPNAGTVIMGGGVDESDEEPEAGDEDQQVVAQQGRMAEGGEPPQDITTVSQIPQDIPDPQGDDIVAKQLREAAIAERDPELQEKLWEEYRKYKAGI